MTFAIKKSGAWATPATMKRKAAGSWVDIATVKAKKAGSWVQVWPMVAITNQSVSRVASTSLTATYTLNTSGIVQKTEGGSTTTLETWLQAGAAGDYEVRATKLSGDSPTGSALATWLPLSSTQAWTLTDAVNDGIPLTCTLTVEIRDTATSTVQDTASITITSERV